VSKYVLGIDADLALNDIWKHIAQDSIDAADRWINKLFLKRSRLWGGFQASPLTRESASSFLLSFRHGKN